LSFNYGGIPGFVRHRSILQVEDDENDILLLRHVFEDVGITNPVHVAHDGQEAIDYLAGVGPYAEREKHPMPGMVLLDLKIPKVMGLEVLRWIRQQPSLKSLIVVVFSSSSHPADVKAAHHLGVSSYCVKPCEINDLRKLAKELKSLFLEDVPLETRHPRAEARRSK
jgi:CheY-like chemotaxis protein